jgi:DivIVA domain-containing protein
MSASDEVHPQEWGGRLSPADVHHVLFTRAGLGRRGYDEVEVDVFLERVQQELQLLIAEKADLRDEVTRLRTALASAGSTRRTAADRKPAAADESPAAAPAAAPTADGALSQEEANLQAVRLLAAAQQTADLYVADAEKYSQRLTVDARDHTEAMLEEARQAARRMVEEAERLAHEAGSRAVEGDAVAAAGVSKEELDRQVAYLRTFGQVVRVQLRSYLEALLRDVEDEWGKADPSAVAGATGGGTGSAAGSAPLADPSSEALPTAPAPAPSRPAAVPDEQQRAGADAAARSPYARPVDDLDLPDRPAPDPYQAEDEHPQQPDAGTGPTTRRRKTVTLHSR